MKMENVSSSDFLISKFFAEISGCPKASSASVIVALSAKSRRQKDTKPDRAVQTFQ